MSRQVRVGILVFAGLVLFLVALFAIGSRSFLFSNTFALQAEFENVGGLRPGAPVQYQGAGVGNVDQVSLPVSPGQPFEVTMSIREKARHLVNSGTVAQIRSQSLVGGGSMILLVNNPDRIASAEPVESGDTIEGQEPFDVSEVSDQALSAVDTFRVVAQEFNQIMRDVQQGRGSLGRFIYDDALYNSTVATADEAQQLMVDLSASADRITGLAEDATRGLEGVLTKVNEGDGTFARLLNDDAAYGRMLATLDTLQGASDNIRAVLSNAENMTQWASLGAYRFSENMEALKHNFLFRRYFEERGYTEKADFEIRESAIEATYQDLEQLQRELNEREARLDALEERVNADRRGRTPEAASSEAASSEAASSEAVPQGAPVEEEEAGTEQPAEEEEASEGAGATSGSSPGAKGPGAAALRAVPKKIQPLAHPARAGSTPPPN